jgi:predicted 3-demethylubiquinone-9 3-methyltransferase (glyoxalase superfamily)
MQKILPHLWFDIQAKDAADFYVSLFPNSKILTSVIMYDTPSGDAESILFELDGYSFQALSGGPEFVINPSISFILNFDPSTDSNAKENLERFWEKLSEGGSVLMPLQEYPFSTLYGWTNDKFGVSWQLILSNPEGEPRPFITPSLMFTNKVSGKAEEAAAYYLSVFKDSKQGAVTRYPKGMEPDKEGTIMFSDFQLENQWFAAMDSARVHDFDFNEAVSFIVYCEDQTEIDYYFKTLSAVPESEQCGWVKDKYGVSWQIIPRRLDEMVFQGTKEQVARVTKVFLPMKKLNIEALEKAYRGES